MKVEDVTPYFTRSDGSYVFARWGRPLAPVVFGVAPETIPVLKGAIEAVSTLAGLEVVETDPELGANFMMFFVTDWSELQQMATLSKEKTFVPLSPDQAALVKQNKFAQNEAVQVRAARGAHGTLRE